MTSRGRGLAKIYISCGFEKEEKQWGDWAGAALRQAGHEPVWFGQGGASTAALEQAKSQLRSCRAVVAFVHDRNGSMPEGVRDELVLASNAGISIIAFWDERVRVQGLLAQAVMHRVPIPRNQADAVSSMQELLGWANKLNQSNFGNVVIGIGALVGGLYLLNRMFGANDEEDGEDEEYDE